jgi:hypothetical protein
MQSTGQLYCKSSSPHICHRSLWIWIAVHGLARGMCDHTRNMTAATLPIRDDLETTYRVRSFRGGKVHANKTSVVPRPIDTYPETCVLPRHACMRRSAVQEQHVIPSDAVSFVQCVNSAQNQSFNNNFTTNILYVFGNTATYQHTISVVAAVTEFRGDTLHL